MLSIPLLPTAEQLGENWWWIFYGNGCQIGGSPWTKDGSKADLTLNLFAKDIANNGVKK